MKLQLNKLFYVIAVTWVIGCTPGAESSGVFIPDDLDRRERTRYLQYVVEGKKLYTTHCSNCHQKDGSGLGKLYPPLAKSDYLLADMNRSICISKNGMSGPILVNGQQYNIAMPEMGKLSALEIAEILTYTTNSWGNQHGFVGVQQVQEALKNCADYSSSSN